MHSTVKQYCRSVQESQTLLLVQAGVSVGESAEEVIDVWVWSWKIVSSTTIAGRGEEKERKVGQIYKLSKPTSETYFLQQGCTFYNLPKEYHLLCTKCSNIWADGRPCSMKHLSWLFVSSITVAMGVQVLLWRVNGRAFEVYAKETYVVICRSSHLF